MNKYYTIILATLQIMVGVFASIYLIKVLIGSAITTSPILALFAGCLGFTLGCKNLINLKNQNK